MHVSYFMTSCYFNWQKIWAHHQLPLCTREIHPLSEPLFIRKMRRQCISSSDILGFGLKRGHIVRWGGIIKDPGAELNTKQLGRGDPQAAYSVGEPREVS